MNASSATSPILFSSSALCGTGTATAAGRHAVTRSTSQTGAAGTTRAAAARRIPLPSSDKARKKCKIKRGSDE
jgi:hypothetical protein